MMVSDLDVVWLCVEEETDLIERWLHRRRRRIQMAMEVGCWHQSFVDHPIERSPLQVALL